MEKVEIRKIIEDIIITQFLNSEMDIVHEEDVTFKELGLDSLDQIELEMMVEQKLNIVITDYDMETIKDMTDLVYKIITERYGKWYNFMHGFNSVICFCYTVFVVDIRI
jgi:acyl carrier protein